MNKTVLLVDDETEIVEVLKIALQKYPEIQVFSAASGAEAFLKISRQKFDLIVTDFKMPDVSGADLLKSAHTDGANKNTPVIVITGFAQDLKKEVLEQTNYKIVEKPFDMEEFSEQIHKQLFG